MSDDYYKNLPKKRLGAGALFLNEKDEVLIVKPSYRDYWLIVGGVVDDNESPKEACIREIREEIGFDVQGIEFLSVDYVFNHDERGERLLFIFFGGVLNDSEIKNIKLDGKEIIDYKFIKIEEATAYLNPLATTRTIKSFEALKDGKVIYLENGK